MSPNPENFTKHRQVRIDDELWDEFGDVVGERRRSEVVRELIKAFLGKPKSRMPKRSQFEQPEG